MNKYETYETGCARVYEEMVVDFQHQSSCKYISDNTLHNNK